MKGVVLSTLLFLTTISIHTLAASGKELTLSGTIVKVEPRWSVDTKKYEFEVTLSLQFKNESSEPVIILRPQGGFRYYGIRTLWFKNENISPSPDSGVEAIEFVRELREEFKARKSEQFWTALKSNDPSVDYFAEIEPDGYFTCEDSVVVQNGFRVRIEPRKKPGDSDEIIAVPEFSGMAIEYRFSAAGRLDGIELLDRARKRWSSSGSLLINKSGEFSVRSGFIPSLRPE